MLWRSLQRQNLPPVRSPKEVENKKSQTLEAGRQKEIAPVLVVVEVGKEG